MRERVEERLLPYVSKPSRYIGGELNAVVKNPSEVDVRVALVFPDAYEIGMSNLGWMVLYHVLNRMRGVQAERVFAPWVDAEEIMRREGIPIFSLETFTPLREFDLIGFSLQYELCYTNVLNILDLAGIPLLRWERSEEDPPIIAGGPCAFNPEPLADFIDAFVIGDGEEVIVEIVEELRKSKNKSDFLDRISRLEGVYLPERYELEESKDGFLIPKGPKVRKRVVLDLESAPYPEPPIVPYMRIVHDRFPLEVMRGCVNGCRFCQAGIIYRPVRERSVRRVAEILEKGIAETGYGDVSLLSLSTCDYSDAYELVKRCVEVAGRSLVSVSLPSSRVDSFSIELARLVQRIRKTGLTFAPEAGTQRLRDVINKPISDEEILRIAREVFGAGWNLIKLYFMVGLPTETDEDVEGIANLVRRVLKRGLKVNRRTNLHVSVATFIPKPHTPFQWERQISMEESRERIKRVMDLLKSWRIKLSWTQPEVSFLEGVFSRGDRKLGRALLEAYKLGCRFDAWGDRLRFDLWEEAFRRAGVDPTIYTWQRRLDEPLPWDHIDPLVTKEFLLKEREKAYKREPTPSCRVAGCMGCGLMRYAREACLKAMTPPRKPEIPEEMRPIERPSPVQKIRGIFHKRGMLRFLAHMEVKEAFERAVRRAAIPIAFSKGFTPHMRLRFGHPAGVGVESLAEIVELDLAERMEPEEVMRRLNEVLPEGLRVVEMFELPLGYPAPMGQRWAASYEVRAPSELMGADEWRRRVEEMLSREEIEVEIGDGKSRDIRPYISEVEVAEEDSRVVIGMELIETPSGRARPEDLLKAMLGGEGIIGRLRIVKTSVRPLEEPGQPLDQAG